MQRVITGIVAADGKSFIPFGKTEDSAHASGDPGMPIFGVRNEALATRADTDGDYSVMAMGRYGSPLVQLISGSSVIDGSGASLLTHQSGSGLATTNVAVANSLFNGGTTWDRQRNNMEGTALASAARTSTTNASDIVNYNGRGVAIWFDITAVPGAQTVTLTVEVKDPVSGKYSQVFAGAAESGIATRFYEVYPGITETSNVDVSVALPRTFRVVVTHSGGGSFTYSVGYCIIL